MIVGCQVGQRVTDLLVDPSVAKKLDMTVQDQGDAAVFATNTCPASVRVMLVKTPSAVTTFVAFRDSRRIKSSAAITASSCRAASADNKARGAGGTGAMQTILCSLLNKDGN